MIKKITFLTFHNWETKRHAGFHALAEYTCKHGIETVFFSFSRPYYIKWMNTERRNKKVYKRLAKGQKYKIGSNSILNVTWPTLALPHPFSKILPSCINRWLTTHSLNSFKKFASTWLKDTDCFVIESNESILLLKKIKKHFPQSIIIYRPSDPIMEHKSFYAPNEINILKHADIVLPINQQSVELYKSKLPDFDEICNYFVLNNGVYLSDYLKNYPSPSILKNKKSALYIGANPNIEWPLLFEAAQHLPDILFVIINPRVPHKNIIDTIGKYKNLVYIPGIERDKVPEWVTNCNVCIDVLKTGYYIRRPVVQITAKILKAIAAKKPYVTYYSSPDIAKYGIRTTYTYSDFINAIDEEVNTSIKKYDIDLRDKDWDAIGKRFLDIIYSHKKTQQLK